MSATLTAGTLSFHGIPLLTDVPANVELIGDSAGAFLRFTAGQASDHLDLPVGKPVFQRFSACHRYEPFWMRPLSGTTIADVPPETQILYLELSTDLVAIVVPILDGSMRCALQGGADGVLHVIADSNDQATQATTVTGLFVAVGSDIETLVAEGARAVAKQLNIGKLRAEKPLPKFINNFGWCTWDAFYQEVTEAKVREGLTTFKNGGVEPTMMILDDGWQSERTISEAHHRQLTAFKANGKFPNGLNSTVRMAKGEFKVEHFIVWHAFQGYWAGVDPEALPQYDIRETARRFNPGILHHWPVGNEKWWGAIAGVVSNKDIYRFYQDYHRELRQQGVDGVKVDNQAASEGLAAEQGGRVTVYQKYHEALEGSVHTHFGGNLINCMSCANDILYATLNSSLTRTSTDFWPKLPETHGLHLYTNAQVCLWFGEFVHGDWDMFQSAHEWGAFHAAGRAVSGSPIYVSDKPGEHDFALLRKLVCADGTTLRCDRPGTPTRDCLFHDVTKEDVLLKIQNTNGHRRTGVVGIFNARYSAEAGAIKPIAGKVSPADVPQLKGEQFAVYLHRAGTVATLARGDSIPLELPQGGWELATVVPIVQGVAIIGLSDKLNSAGAVADQRRQGSSVEITLRDGGAFLAHVEKTPRSVTLNGSAIPFTLDKTMLRIEIPHGESPRLAIEF